ncbi:MAG: hypothetical protein SPE65_08685 [Muribaculaceae bacterium]|nr:hypothetical protein [Muribaculaceae bacterium]MDY5120037.1 hypothetical protein [Muribaculaceae bacterium]
MVITRPQPGTPAIAAMNNTGARRRHRLSNNKSAANPPIDNTKTPNALKVHKPRILAHNDGKNPCTSLTVVSMAMSNNFCDIPKP